MVVYGPWVQEGQRPFVRESPGAMSQTIPAATNDPFTPYTAPRIRAELLPQVYDEPITAAFDTLLVSDTLWHLSYDYWATLSHGVFFQVYSVNASVGWRHYTLMDPVAHTWRSELLDRLQADDPAVVDVEFYPTDPYHGTTSNRRMVVHQEVVSSTYVERTVMNDPSAPALIDPGTVTDVHLLNAASPGLELPDGVAPFVQYFHDFGVPDDQQGNIGAYSAPFTPNMIRSDVSHPTLGQPPLTETDTELSVDPDVLAWTVDDADTPPGEVLPKAGVVTIAPRVLTGYTTGGDYLDWPNIGEPFNEFRGLSVLGHSDYVCDWLPPRYRAVYARRPELPPLRQFPRDDGRGASAGTRIWPPPRSQQGSSRVGPGSYY